MTVAIRKNVPMLSRFTAITITPFLCDLFFKEEIAKGEGEDEKDPNGGALFVACKKLLDLCMRRRVVTLVLLVAMLAAAWWSTEETAMPGFVPLFLARLICFDGRPGWNQNEHR